MYVLDLLKSSQSNQPQPTDVAAFEYRLLCSGELYNSEIITTDWRKSAVTRLLLRKPFSLTVCSSPFDDYPQELCLRFQTGVAEETRGNSSFSFYPDEEIARDIAAILSLLLRRLITVTAKVREIHPRRYEHEPDFLLDHSVAFVKTLTPIYWKREPAAVIYGMEGISEIIDYNPLPLGVIPDNLSKLLTGLALSQVSGSLILSARLYSQALRQIKDEAELAYQSLISCVETLANETLQDYSPGKVDMIESKKSLFDMAIQLGIERDKAEQLALEACSGNPWASRKFTKFLVEKCGEDIWEKDDDLFRLDRRFWPKQEEFERTIKSIYGVRSGATHQGRPYPNSIAVGIGPTMKFEGFRELNFGGPNPLTTRIPPVVWFERLVNCALNNFINSIAINETMKEERG
jgi:hypothetical protein